MSLITQKDPGSATKERRVRARRSRTSLTDQNKRQRTLWEILEIIDFLLERGSLSGFDQTLEDHEDAKSLEIAVKLQLKHNTARKLLRLRDLIFNKESWIFLRDSSRLGVFSDFHFTKPYGTIQNDGGTLSLDFLDAFINSKRPFKGDEEMKQRTRARKFDALVLSFSHDSRDFLVTMFLKSVAAISTLCSFIPSTGDMTWSQIMDIVARFTNRSWESDAKQKEYHNDVHHKHLVDGWHIVSEVYKVQVQELFFSKSSSETSSTTSFKVQLDDVKSSACEFTKHLVCEFFAWCVLFLKDSQKKGYSVDALLNTLDELYEKLAESIGVKPSEEHTIQEDYVRTLIDGVAQNQPTMAEIKYDCKEMTPYRREARINSSNRMVLWRTADILMRCRLDGSPARKFYEKFLEKAEAEDEKRLELGPQNLKHTSGDPASDDICMRDETPDLADIIEKCPLKRTASEMNERNDETALRDEERKKRMRATRDSNSRRLTVALHQERISRGADLRNRYCDDGDSSNEERTDGSCYSQAENLRNEQNVLQEVNLVMQLLYELILDWPVLPVEDAVMDTNPDSLAEFNVPMNKADRSKASDILTGDHRFVGIHAEMRRGNFYTDVTKARSITRYAEHWRHMLPFEIRGMVSDAVSELLPSVKEDTRKRDRWAEDIDNERYLNLVVNNSSVEKGLLNITCRSTNPIVNKRLVTELQGGTLCAGYIRGMRNNKERRRTHSNKPWSRTMDAANKIEKFSTLVLIACRRVHWDADDEYDWVNMQAVDEVIVHLAVSRERMRHINGIWENDTVRLVFLCPLTPHLRMFKSVQEATLLPDEIAQVLCGPPENRPIVPSIDELRLKVDSGCYSYLLNVRRTTSLIDDSQMEALLSTLGNIGDAKTGSASVSLVQGPPGTGKTTLLNILIGALLHHSTYGHVGREEINELNNELGCDGILRRNQNPDALGILVCAGSNQAVDNVLRRMDEENGIPDGKGGGLHPQAVRLARQGYDYGTLKKYSVNDKALPFDLHIHNRNQPHRVSASSAARRSLSKEVIVGFTTCSTSGGARLKNLRGKWDVIIMDEAGQANEPETIIPIVNAYKRNMSRRAHVILCGDQRQLPPMVCAKWMMHKGKNLLPFNYAAQMKSLFERLQRRGRCPFSMLTTQYRSHPCIARLVSSTFYEGIVASVKPPSEFIDKYNGGCSAAGRLFAPVTLIDTSKLPYRFERNDQKGAVENMLEVDIIKELLDELRSLTGNNFHLLRKQIAVLAPYRAQVNLIRCMLERDHYYKTGTGPTRRGFEIVVDTVDSMQGDERDIVFFSGTRSNNDQSVGFVDHPNRLNVAVSRARKLLVIIADMKTMSVSKEFQTFWNYTAKGYNDAALLVRQVGRPGNDTGYSQLFVQR